MIDQILLRRRVRVVLAAMQSVRMESRASEQLIFDKCEPDFPGLKANDLSFAIGWNHTKGYVDYVYSTDEERNEWFLTQDGRQKEGLA